MSIGSSATERWSPPRPLRRADLGIAGGRIEAVGKRLAGLETIDASGRLVLPGSGGRARPPADARGRVHLQRRFFTGTVAAACGGTTRRRLCRARERARPWWRHWRRRAPRPMARWWSTMGCI